MRVRRPKTCSRPVARPSPRRASKRQTQGRPGQAKVLKGDTAFGLELERDGEQIIVRALSLHRPPSVYGLKRVTPQRVPKPKQQARALQLAVNDGLKRAWRTHRAGARGGRAGPAQAEALGAGDGARRRGAPVPSRTRCAVPQAPARRARSAHRAVEVKGFLEDEVLYAPRPTSRARASRGGRAHARRR